MKLVVLGLLCSASMSLSALQSYVSWALVEIWRFAGATWT